MKQKARNIASRPQAAPATRAISNVDFRDDQFTNIRNCIDTLGMPTVIDRVAVILDCDDVLLWNIEGEDFTRGEAEPGSREINREDKTSSLALAQTFGTNMVYGFEYPIIFQQFSKFEERMLLLDIAEMTSGRDGQGIVDISNGGIWFWRTFLWEQTDEPDIEINVLYQNLKASTMPSVLEGIGGEDVEFTWSLLVEDWPLIQVTNVPPSFGIPTHLAVPEFTYSAIGATGTGVTITEFAMVDEESLVLNDAVTFYVYDADNSDTLLYSETLESPSSDVELLVDLSTISNVNVIATFKAQEAVENYAFFENELEVVTAVL